MNTMASTISVRLDKPTLKELSEVEKKWHTDRSEAIRRLLAKAIGDWKIKNSLESIKERRISVGKAAENCGISLWEMIDLVKKNNIDWIGYNEEDLEKELSLIK